jgi:hypothetical protein
MHERPDRTLVAAVAGLLIVGTILVSAVFSGGQVSRILSTVGSSINGGSSTSSGGGTDDGAGARPAPSAATGSGSDGQVADLGATPPTILIIRTGTLQMAVADVDAAVAAGQAAVVRAGGYVSASDRSAASGSNRATVTYRIPGAAWDATLAALHGLARQVEDEQIKTDEVTGQAVDLAAQLSNLRATEAALQAIMARATRIADVLDVQDKLTTTRGSIEKLVAEQDHLDDQVAYGSLAVTFSVPPVPAPAATPKPAKGWDPGEDAAQAAGKLVRIGQRSATAGIWLAIVGLPVLAAAIVLGLVAWSIVRLGRFVLARRPGAADPA